MIFESFGLICSLSDEIQHLKLIAIEIPVVLLPHCLPTDGLFVNNRSSKSSIDRDLVSYLFVLRIFLYGSRRFLMINQVLEEVFS
jgi:hypothetical protein